MKGNEWLDHHMETFVKPHLGYIPSCPEVCPTELGSELWTFTPRMVACLVAAWQDIKRKAGSDPILLPGRDVWPLEVIARLEDYPTTFMPIISSVVAGMMQKTSLPKAVFPDHFAVDTGYAGSVPKALGCLRWALISNSACRTAKKSHKTEEFKVYEPFMVLAHRRVTTAEYNPENHCSDYSKWTELERLACAMECSKKYWERGNWGWESGQSYPGKPKPKPDVQVLSNKDEFKKAAMTTQFIVKHAIPIMAKRRPL